VEALSRDLERLAINLDSTLYQLSSYQEETQSTTDDSISQATCAQYPGPANNIGTGKVDALQCFVNECSIRHVASIMKRPGVMPRRKRMIAILVKLVKSSQKS